MAARMTASDEMHLHLILASSLDDTGHASMPCWHKKNWSNLAIFNAWFFFHIISKIDGFTQIKTPNGILALQYKEKSLK